MSNDLILSTIFEKVNYTIDEDLKKMLQIQKVRQDMLKKYGEKAFLDHKELKFPVINPKTGQYDCKLIYASILRASVHSAKGGSSKNPKSYYDNMKNKAITLYKSNNCSEKLKIKLSEESTEQVDILILNSIFEITENEYDTLLETTNYMD